MRLPWRKRNEPPGVWRGKPELYSRWKCGGVEYRLTYVTADVDHRSAPTTARITLEYTAENVHAELVRKEAK